MPKSYKLGTSALLMGMAVLLYGCAQPVPLKLKPVSSQDSMRAIRQYCIEKGARSDTPLFYECVGSRLEIEKQNGALAKCESSSIQENIKVQCQSSDAIGSPDYGQRMENCRRDLTKLCQQLAIGG